MASPGSKQVCPNSADCWSPAMPGDRQRQVEERRRVGRRDLAPVGHQLGQRVAGYAEQLAQLVGPVAGAEVEEQRAAGVGDVGDVVGPAGHPGDQVGVDGADGVPARLDQRPGVRLVLGQPHQLGAGEVGVQPQPGQLGDPLLVALVLEPRADVGGTPVLPDDRPPRRAERLAVPEQDRLALVGDADRLQLRRRRPARWPRGSPRGWPARSPRASAPPSPAGGSAGGTPRSPWPRSAPSSVTTTAVTPVVPASIARTLIGGATRPSPACADDVEDLLVDPGQVGADPHLVVLGADPGLEVAGALRLRERLAAPPRAPGSTGTFSSSVEAVR